MAIFRVEKIRDYTVMSNHHLKNKALSLKAKGLLSLILSLPNDWDFTMRGLAAISVEGVDAIRQAIVELEKQGYVVRSRVRDSKGHLRGAEYVIYEQPLALEAPAPQTEASQPLPEAPIQDAPTAEPSAHTVPALENPVLGTATQLSTYRENTHMNQIRTAANPYPSYPYPSYPETEEAPARTQMGTDGMGPDAAVSLRDEIRQRIGYEALLSSSPTDQGRLDEIVELMAETLCARKGTLNIAGCDYDLAFVRERMLRINSQHIQYVFHCLNQNKSQIRNIKSYLLAVLFNAPSTMESYYAALINENAIHPNRMDLSMDELPYSCKCYSKKGPKSGTIINEKSPTRPPNPESVVG